MATVDGDVEWEQGLMTATHRVLAKWENRQHPLEWFAQVRRRGSTRGLHPCPALPWPASSRSWRVKGEPEAKEEEVDQAYLADIAEAVGESQSYYKKKATTRSIS